MSHKYLSFPSLDKWSANCDVTMVQYVTSTIIMSGEKHFSRNFEASKWTNKQNFFLLKGKSQRDLKFSRQSFWNHSISSVFLLTTPSNDGKLNKKLRRNLSRSPSRKLEENFLSQWLFRVISIIYECRSLSDVIKITPSRKSDDWGPKKRPKRPTAWKVVK